MSGSVCVKLHEIDDVFNSPGQMEWDLAKELYDLSGLLSELQPGVISRLFLRGELHAVGLGSDRAVFVADHDIFTSLDDFNARSAILSADAADKELILMVLIHPDSRQLPA